jgi:AraC-like DNA-binding protein
MNPIQLDYVVPPDDLSPYITVFYRFFADVRVFEDRERADRAQLRFRLDPNPGSYTFVDGNRQEATPCHLIGPTSGAMTIRGEGPVHVFGMGLTPCGWHAILGTDASAWLNRLLDAEAVFGPVIQEAAFKLRAAGTAQAMADVAVPFVRSLVAGGDSETLRFVRDVDAWLSDCASPDVEVLVGATGLSRRQIERRCNSLYGAPPKLLARKYRALRAAVAVATARDGLEAFLAEGFYDQSHMIRELKQFVGLTPGQLRAESSLFQHLTITRRHALQGQVARIITDT